MSLITRCPACQTMFRVVPDQLRVSQGWVRCGHCEQVFDGNAHLQPPEVVRAFEAPLSDSASIPTEPATKIPENSTPEPMDWGPLVQQADQDFTLGLRKPSDDLVLPEVPVAASAPAATAAPSAAPAIPVVPGPLSQTTESTVQTVTVADQREQSAESDTPLEIDPILGLRPSEAIDKDTTASVPAPVDSDQPFSRAASDDHLLQVQPAEGPRYLQAQPPQPSTEQDPRISFLQPVRPQRPAHQRLWIALCGLALLTLLGQVVIFERDRLGVLLPGLRPVLQLGCEYAGCMVQPPRRIEAVAIESSSFVRLRGDVYRLGFALRNTSSGEVALPALEITLTDLADRPLLRKVVHPADYAAALPIARSDMQVAGLPGASEQGANLGLEVKLEAGSPAISGYRLLAFYP